MFKLFYPYEYVRSVFTIDYEKLYSKGFRAIIFDIDNTLAHHGEPPTKELEDLLQRLKNMGFQILLLSNNSRDRIDKFNKNINALCLYDVGKPKKGAYLESVELLGLKKEQIVFVGDQIFTDIFGANRVGLPNILVRFMRKNPNAKIGKRRHVEKVVLNFYRKSKKYRFRLGNIEKRKV